MVGVFAKVEGHLVLVLQDDLLCLWRDCLVAMDLNVALGVLLTEGTAREEPATIDGSLIRLETLQRLTCLAVCCAALDKP